MGYEVVITKNAQEDLDNFMLYRIVDNQVFVDSILHELQDYENKIN